MISIAVITLTIILCLVAILLSSLAFSGTWLVFLAALIAYFSMSAPSIVTLVLFLILCIGTEVVESIASYHGIQKRGGSKRAGLGALAGGIIGTLVGTAIMPIVGTILGMLIGSFALAYGCERMIIKQHDKAAHIARGAIWARLQIMFLKTALTMIMSVWLIYRLVQAS